jgi:leader peptidase (prepilin peptidase)/N-methyltransferase
MEVALIVIFVILGVSVGSFLNVCIDRIPTKGSLLSPPSHCDACQRRLAAKDLVPIFSYLWLRGRCRYCRAPVPRRVLGVEITTGALFGYLAWQHGLSAGLGITIFYCSIFIILMLIDWEHGILPNKIIYPSMIVAIIFSILRTNNILQFYNVSTYVPPEIAQAGIGAGIGLGLALLVVLLSRGGMGFGDVKMAGLIGLVTGYPLVFFNLILAAIIGGVAALVLIVGKKKKRKESIPFGPALSVATIITLLWGTDIVSWYLGLI